MPVLADFPQVTLVAVGPEPNGEWRMASERVNGRIKALGTRWDNELLYTAADVYLDSVPFSSITSLLEAGCYGIPLLGYTSRDPEFALLEPGAPGLSGTMHLASDSTWYRSLLARLVEDQEFRSKSGTRLQEKIVSLHTGVGWTLAVENLYKELSHIPSRNCLLGKDDGFENGPLNLALNRLYPPNNVNSGSKVYRMLALSDQGLGHHSPI